MYRAPSRRKRKSKIQRLNLIPILDAVFIFIFFLLMSANFIKIFEIQSDVPIVSDQLPPPDQKKPLALTLKISNSDITIHTGVPSVLVKKISKLSPEAYDLESLHSYLIGIKQQNLEEKSVILEPLVDLTYEEIVKIMDSIRLLRKTDPTLYIKGTDGIDQKVETLFNNIVFGNIQS